jgi:hypothetical protein
MQRRIWVIVGTVAAVLALSGVAILLIPGLLAKERPISEATSPDGSWSVAVVAHPTVSGSYELVVEVRDAHGQLAGESFVIGLTRNLVAAEQEHAVKFIDNATAKVGSRILEKAKFIRQ